jgi:uncharacterized integral membrane protein (TIGR00697 family)
MRGELDRSDKVYMMLTVAFGSCLVMSTVLARKPILVAGLLVDFAVFAYATTFVITDIVAEIWGRGRARLIVVNGFVCLVVAFLWTGLALAWPAAPSWQHEGAFQVVLGSTARVMLGGFVAYLAAQFYDVWSFLLLKRKTKGRYLWLRTNVSTIPAQVIDTFIFITIGFYGVLPLGELLVGVLTVKIGIAVMEQFVVYLAIWILRRPALDFGSPAPDLLT